MKIIESIGRIGRGFSSEDVKKERALIK